MSHLNQNFGIAIETGSIVIFSTDPPFNTFHNIPATVGLGSDVAITSDCSRAILTNFNPAAIISLDLLQEPPVIIDTELVPTAPGRLDVDITPENRFAVTVNGAFPMSPILSYSLQESMVVDSVAPPPSGLQAVAISPNGNGLVLTARLFDNLVRIFNIDNTGNLTDTGTDIATGGNGPINITFTRDGKFAFVAHSSSVLGILNTTNPNAVFLAGTVPLQNGTNSLTIVVSRNGSLVFVLSNSAVNIYTFTPTPPFLTPVTFFLHGLVILPFFGVDQMALDPTGTRLFISAFGVLRAFTTTGTDLGDVPGVVAMGGVATCRRRTFPSTQPTDCIRVQKVYDWVIVPVEGNKQITIPDDCLPFVQQAQTHNDPLAVQCICSAPGCDVTSPFPLLPKPQPRPAVGEVTCQVCAIKHFKHRDADMARVKLVQAIPLNIEIMNERTGEKCGFTTTVTLSEVVVLCLPKPLDENNILCRAFNIECDTTGCIIDGNQLDVLVSLCKDVQVEAEVKLLMQGRSCKPRGVIDIPIQNNCPPIEFPEQCDFFPTENCDCQGIVQDESDIQLAFTNFEDSLIIIKTCSGRAKINATICNQCNPNESDFTFIFNPTQNTDNMCLNNSIQFTATEFFDVNCTFDPNGGSATLTTTGEGDLTIGGSPQSGNITFTLTLSETDFVGGSDDVYELNIFKNGILIVNTLVGGVLVDDGDLQIVDCGTGGDRRFAYVANQSNNTVEIYDISAPTAPIRIGEFNAGNLDLPSGMAITGNILYVTNQGNNTVEIYDISAPTAPVRVGEFNAGNLDFPFGLAITGNILYVTNSNDNTVEIYNILTPTNPIRVGEFNAGNLSGPTGMAITGNILYVTNSNDDTVEIYNIFNPTAPVRVDEFNAGNLSSPFGIAITGNILYVANLFDDNVEIYDISIPIAPVHVGEFNAGNLSGPTGMAITGNILYVTNLFDNTVEIYNIFNPTAPVRVDEFNAGNLDGPIAIVIHPMLFNLL